MRFEVGTHALAPDLEVLAPARNWGMTRADSVDFAEKWEIPIRATKEKIYSIDENLWGRAIECGAIEDPWADAARRALHLDASHRQRACRADDWSSTRASPTEIDGVAMELAELIAVLNARAGSTGFGRLDMVENRRVGIKSREVYECPAALALIAAHADLEDMVLERDLRHEKSRLETRWAELVYDGMWFSPLKEALDAFVDETQRHVTGDVRLRFDAPGLHARRRSTQPEGALRLRARDLRRCGHLSPQRLRGLRAHLRPRGQDLGRSARARRTRRPRRRDPLERSVHVTDG